MYSGEKVARLVVALLKEHGVRYCVVSPGTTNFGIVGCVQHDPFFTVFSAPDERSAAYMACGIAELNNEPVAISCTGATASRNYLPALTEAYYRKLPIIALTSFNGSQNIGQLMPQNLNRSRIQEDVALYSVDLPLIKDDRDEKYCNRVVNEALLEARRRGGGPVHINLTCDYAHGTFDVRQLETQRSIKRFSISDELPPMADDAKIVIFIGAHRIFDQATNDALEAFATSRDAVVLTDHTGNYHGGNRIQGSLVAENTHRLSSCYKDLAPDHIIDIGEVSGDYPTASFLKGTNANVWRVSPDGELRDRFGSLSAVFEMEELHFFESYLGKSSKNSGFYEAWLQRFNSLSSRIPDLPFTNRWIAREASGLMPPHSVLHCAILNSLRSWNYFEIDHTINCFSNTGGFGIDGCLSAAIGSSLVDADQLVVLVIGDLAFFYDMNALGNRHLSANLRVLLINNGLGVEFRMPYSPAAVLDKGVDPYIAAAGHYSNHFSGGVAGGPTPAQAWSESLGMAYLSARNKAELGNALGPFFSSDSCVPIVLECFVDPDREVEAAQMLANLDADTSTKKKVVSVAKQILPNGVQNAIKKKLS